MKIALAGTGAMGGDAGTMGFSSPTCGGPSAPAAGRCPSSTRWATMASVATKKPAAAGSAIQRCARSLGMASFHCGRGKARTTPAVRPAGADRAGSPRYLKISLFFA